MAFVVLISFLFLTLFLLIYVYVWLKNRYSYWSKRGVKGPTPYPIVGNAGGIMFLRESVHDFAKRLYDDFPDEKVVGFYQGLTPALLVRDPEWIKEVTTRGFESFQGRGLRQRDDRFEDNLFLAEGDTWKALRQKIDPFFTPGKVKQMMPLVESCLQRFLDHVDNLIIKEGPEHDLRTLSKLVMCDINGSCSFGVSLNIYSQEKNLFVKVAEDIFTLSTTLGIRRFIEILFPGFEKLLNDWCHIASPVHHLRDFFLKLIKEIVDQREGKTKHNFNLMNMLIELKEEAAVDNGKEREELLIDDDLIAAQAISFYAAGFEPTSLFLTFLFFELALQPDIQQRLYKEISSTLKKLDGKLSYESLSEMQYLGMVCEEIFRKYSVSSNRKCSKQFTFPEDNLTVEKGTPIIIPVNGLHLSPEHFADPQKFDPERFSPENRSNIPTLAFMPFGAGPRQCTGQRFGRTQCLMGAAYFLNRFRVYPTSQTPRSSSELTTDPRFITLRTVQAVILGIERRQTTV